MWKEFHPRGLCHEMAGNSFVSGLIVQSGLRLYPKVRLC